MAYNLREYFYPVTHGIFFDSNGHYNKEIIKKFKSASKELFYERMIEDYLKGIRLNSIQNMDKAKKIGWHNHFFLAFF